MGRKTLIMRLVAGLAAVALAGAYAPAQAQSSGSGMTSLALTPAVRALAASATVVHRKSLGVGPAVQATGARETLSSAQAAAASAAHPSAGGGGGYGSVRYPADLYGFGGSTVQYAKHHPIYLNTTATHCNPSCWGNPAGFLQDLSKSNFIHVVDQYVGANGYNRYPVGTQFITSGIASPSPAFTDNDMIALAIAAAKISGAGYGHMYHIFLPPGVDECFDDTYTVCYSPDNFPTFYYCAYHSSVDVPGVGHVVYSVEPYQNTVGCNVRPGTPNGSLVDSTNSVLSHEVFETITDVDGDGWWNLLNNGIYGEEIGDECSFLVFTSTDVYFDPSVWNAGGGHRYATQPEYDNNQHACTTAP